MRPEKKSPFRPERALGKVLKNSLFASGAKLCTAREDAEPVESQGLSPVMLSSRWLESALVPCGEIPVWGRAQLT